MAEEKKKLYRSNDDRWIAGVCGGIADYFNIDATLVRVLFILFGFVIGGSIILYIILWLIIPQAPLDNMLEGSAPEDNMLEDLISDAAEEAGDEE
jgi:phage shock protein C